MYVYWYPMCVSLTFYLKYEKLYFVSRIEYLYITIFVVLCYLVSRTFTFHILVYP